MLEEQFQEKQALQDGSSSGLNLCFQNPTYTLNLGLPRRLTLGNGCFSPCLYGHCNAPSRLCTSAFSTVDRPCWFELHLKALKSFWTATVVALIADMVSGMQ